MSTIYNKKQTIKILESFLPCTYKEAQAANRWKSKQSIELQLWTNQQSVNRYLSLKKLYKDIDSNIISLAAALIVSFEANDAYKKMHRKNTNFQSDNIILLDLLEFNQFYRKKRVSKKRDTLARKYSQIIKWRELGISYQSIATKILTIDGDSISHEYIRKFIIEHKGVDNG